MKLQITDFTFSFVGHGHYKVTFTSPSTGKQWTRTTTNMSLIDATKNEDNPKQKDLNSLKRFTKESW